MLSYNATVVQLVVVELLPASSFAGGSNHVTTRKVKACGVLSLLYF